MEITNIPITLFYEHCLSGARKSGFKWVVCLIAREADVEGLYINLHRSWVSLDSITGKYFLFIFAGKESNTQEQREISKISDTNFNYVNIYNDYVHIVNQDIKLSSTFYSPWRNDYDVNAQKLHENQTLAVNSLRDYFSISEIEIPCLIFSSLFSKKNHIIPISGNDIYGYFKSIFNQIHTQLNTLNFLETKMNLLEIEEHKLNIEILNCKFTDYEVIRALHDELNILANETNNSILIDCIMNKYFRKLEQPVRGKLNKYIDLVKNYESRTNHSFDPNSTENSYQEKIKNKRLLELKLNKVNEEIYKCSELQSCIFAEIDKIIGESKMDGNKSNSNEVSITINGGTPQINTAFNGGSICANQQKSADLVELSKLLNSVGKTLPSNLSPDDADLVSANLERIEFELNQKQPQSAFIMKALTGLQAIKGTVEFGNAVISLVTFAQGFFK